MAQRPESEVGHSPEESSPPERFGNVVKTIWLLADTNVHPPDKDSFLGSWVTPVLHAEDRPYRFHYYNPGWQSYHFTYSKVISCQELQFVRQGHTDFLKPIWDVSLGQGQLGSSEGETALTLFEAKLGQMLGSALQLEPWQAKDLGLRLEFLKNLPGYEEAFRLYGIALKPEGGSPES